MTTPPKIMAVIPAAGIGSRMKADKPKQYLEIAGKTILEQTILKLSQVSEISTLMLAISSEDEHFSKLALCDGRIKTCIGGAERANTVLNALLALEPASPDWVLVHDAARPLVRVEDIHKLIHTCIEKQEGGILASKVKDTIKRGQNYSQETVPRTELWQALTPQLFPFKALLSALKEGLHQKREITDEASAMELAQQPVLLVEGSSDNLKVTAPEDLALAEFILTQQEKAQ